jgi:RNA polymerase sigma factor (TIGR02999 family)
LPRAIELLATPADNQIDVALSLSSPACPKETAMGIGRASDLGGTVTRLIAKIEAGDEEAHNQLCELVYGQLRVIARRFRHRMNVHSCETTEVVHELVGGFMAGDRFGKMKNRRYFYAAAADQIRRLLIEHLRRRARKTAGGHLRRVALEPWLDELRESTEVRCGSDMESLDLALTRLKKERPRQHLIVQLKFFAGLTNAQIADSLNVSVDTIKREWRVTRAWLGSRLSKKL